MRSELQRGQALVLACLYMLLLTLMVVMTLSISQRIRDKIELNTLAESAAYSNAAAEARALNGVALMNRAAIAHWINLAGVESLISWTAAAYSLFEDLYFGLMEQVQDDTDDSGAPTQWMVKKALYRDALMAAFPASEENAVPPNMNRYKACRKAVGAALKNTIQIAFRDSQFMDIEAFSRDATQAGLQGRRLQDAIASLASAEADLVASTRAKIHGTGLAQSIVDLAQPRDIVSMGSVNDVNDWNLNVVEGGGLKVWDAVMDARSPFIKNRTAALTGVERYIKNKVNDLLNGTHSGWGGTSANGRSNWVVDYAGSFDLNATYEGHGCYGTDIGSCEASRGDWTNVLAQDRVHVKATMTFTRASISRGPIGVGANGPFNCPGITFTPEWDSETNLLASDIHHDDDRVNFDKVNRIVGDEYMPPAEAIAKLTMGPCTKDPINKPCHSVYVPVYTLADTTGPLHGQPKSYALLQRDANLRTRDPWDLSFRFRFGQSSAGSNVDFGATQRPQASVGTAIAYYHRRGRFTETPNLFNPYWRATLIGAKRGQDDVAALGLSADATDGWRALDVAGYGGEN